MIASLVLGGLLLTGMIVATWYAAVRLPGSARVPLHAGTPEYSLWLSKRAGLSVWLAAGAVAFTALAWLTLSRAAQNWVVSMRVTLLPAVMFVALAAEVAAIILARTSAARTSAAEAGGARVPPEAEPQTVHESDDSGESPSYSLYPAAASR